MKKNWILATFVAVAVTFGSMAQTTPSQTTPTTPAQKTPSSSYPSGNKKDKKMKKDSTGTYGTQKKDTVGRK